MAIFGFPSKNPGTPPTVSPTSLRAGKTGHAPYSRVSRFVPGHGGTFVPECPGLSRLENRSCCQARGVLATQRAIPPMTAVTHRSQLPDTALAHAFLRALVAWAERRSAEGRVMLPAGAVDADELVHVVVALLHARSNSKLRADHGARKE